MSKAFVARLLVAVFVVSALVTFMPERVAGLAPGLSRGAVGMVAWSVAVVTLLPSWWTREWRDAGAGQAGWPGGPNALYFVALACGVFIMFFGDHGASLLGLSVDLLLAGAWVVVGLAILAGLFFPVKAVRTA